MRIPALLQRYCLSICSGDFNEWIWKNITLDWGSSYMFTFEYDMYEFNLGNTFNYAEMAALIAPAHSSSTSGHADTVGLDEYVAFEYAKVRRFYAQLGLSGPHGDRVLHWRAPDSRAGGDVCVFASTFGVAGGGSKRRTIDYLAATSEAGSCDSKSTPAFRSIAVQMSESVCAIPLHAIISPLSPVSREQSRAKNWQKCRLLQLSPAHKSP